MNSEVFLLLFCSSHRQLDDADICTPVTHVHCVCFTCRSRAVKARGNCSFRSGNRPDRESEKAYTHTHLHKHSSVKHCLAIVSPSLYSALASQHVTQHSFCVSVSSTTPHRPTHMTCLSTLASSEGGDTTAIIIIRAVQCIVCLLFPFYLLSIVMQSIIRSQCVMPHCVIF